MERTKKPLGHTIWFKIILTFMVFIPNFTQIPYNQADTTSAISSVMTHPLIVSIEWLLPIFKLLLLGAAVAPFIMKSKAEKALLYYYAAILAVVGLFQNMARTENYGFIWLIGNTVIEFTVLAFCIYDLVGGKTNILKGEFSRSRIWIIPLMLLAFLMPYSISNTNAAIPAFPVNMLYNEAGVTYCMITPVVIGTMLLFSKGVYKPTLSIVSYVGLLFGLLNAMTWFAMQSESWWMGILHLPLLIISIYGLVVAHRERVLVVDL